MSDWRQLIVVTIWSTGIILVVYVEYFVENLKTVSKLVQTTEAMSKQHEESTLIKSSSSSESDTSLVTAKVTRQLVFATLVAVLGSSFQFGYSTGVINAPQVVIEQFYNRTISNRRNAVPSEEEIKLLWSVTVSIFAIGGMIGSSLVGYFASKFGRRRSMLANNVVVLAAVVFVILCNRLELFELLIVARLLFGINSGANTGLAPMYLTEIAPVRWRGAFGTLNQMGIVLAILLSQVLGLPQLLGTTQLWVVLLCIPGFFSLAQISCLPFCPETPAYLIAQGKNESTRISLRWLRGTEQVDAEVHALESQRRQDAAESRVSIADLFRVRHLRRPMLIAIMMQCSQQLSGINAVFYYSTSMFEQAGVPHSSSAYVTVGMGVVNVVVTAASVLLMEKAGRRLLHLIGLGGMFVCAVILTITLQFATKWTAGVSVAAVLVFVMFFQSGPGSIPWFITAELFQPAARPSAVAVAGLVNWTGNFLVGLVYLPLDGLIHSYTFVIFAVLIAVFWVFTFWKVPETRGKSIEQISRMFRASSVASLSS